MNLFSNELKEATKTVHLSLERALIEKIKSVESISDYIEILKLFYGFYKPLEEATNIHLNKLYLEDAVKRRKTDWILEDINSLSPNHFDKNFVCHNIPRINSHSNALGAMYVMEGSTLGGEIIKKMISSKLKHPEQKVYSFLSGYGADNIKMWTTFKDAVDRTPPSEHQEVISTARETFEKFSIWINFNDGNN